MNGLLKNVTNAIWHAFNALHQEEFGLVNKSKLKVLTANIATVLDLYGVEKGLDHFKSTITLDFENFQQYLQQEVFVSLPKTLTMREHRIYEERIEEICWLICRTKYLNKGTTKCLDDKHLYKLFRIFCLLSDFMPASESERKNCEVLMNSSEALLVIQQIMRALGLDFEDDKKVINLTNNNDVSFDFNQFLELIDFKNHTNILEYKESLHEIIEEMYQTYLKDIIKKGYLLRRGYLLPTFKEYWFVLQPCELSYYKNHYEKDLCGTIILDQKCIIKPNISPSSSSLSGGSSKHDKFLKFALSSGDRNFELAAHDHRTRMQWITALQLAITYSIGCEGFQRDNITRRRCKREIDYKRKKAEEQLRTIHMKEVEIAKLQLEQEKQARLAAEIQARELEAIAKEDSRRVAELEDMKQTLEKLLEEEMQAKRDEEIVRALQARVLAEEWEKREELEELQRKQKIMLEEERKKRIEFESIQKENEKKLYDAENRLKELEDERKKLDFELKQARFKIIRSGEDKEDLEARMDALYPILRNNNNSTIRRTVSFVVPTTRERPTTFEDIRASTLRRKSKKI